MSATPGSQIPLAFAKERRFTNSPTPGSHILPGNVEPVRYEQSQNLSSLRAPYDQDTQQNARPPFTPFEVKPSQGSFLPRGPSPFFILKESCHEPSSSVIIPVIATHDGFSNWRINLSEKMDDMTGSFEVKHAGSPRESQQWQHLARIPRHDLTLLVMTSPR